MNSQKTQKSIFAEYKVRSSVTVDKANGDDILAMSYTGKNLKALVSELFYLYEGERIKGKGSQLKEAQKIGRADIGSLNPDQLYKGSALIGALTIDNLNRSISAKNKEINSKEVQLDAIAAMSNPSDKDLRQMLLLQKQKIAAKINKDGIRVEMSKL